MQRYKEMIFDYLKQDTRLWDDVKTEFNQSLFFDLIDKGDDKIIELLFNNNEIRALFFIKIKDAYVLKINDLKFFFDENKINNSFTKYENRIGLSDRDGLIKNRGEVVINFPFKDCYLEGGQSTEEGMDTYFEKSEKDGNVHYVEKKSKRKEILFNQVLARDEIDRLLDDKALINWKRFTKEGELKVTEIKRNEENQIKENLIIKGNNLLALQCLKSQFAGRIKLIYIDPPYNTETDSFKYNDKFTRSTYLTFMKNRLEIAKDLLAKDGVLFLQCDNNQQAYIKVLLDEIFGENNFRNNIIWKKVLSGKKQSNFLSNVTEFILVYSVSDSIKINQQFLEAEEAKDLKNYPYIEEETGKRYGSFDFTQKGQGPARYFNGKLLSPPKGKHWIWDQEKIDKGIAENRIIFTKNGTPRVKRYLEDKEGNPLSDLWNDEEVKIISANDKQRLEFDGQKPEALLKRIIEINTEENDIVLDFFMGTGTTCAVAHKMNRQYIGVEQLDYGKVDATKRLQDVINGEQSGISKSINWQGGGDFIYCELAKWNERAIDEILKCSNFTELLALFDDMYDKYFLNYNLKVNEFRNKVVKENDFINLSLEEQKKMFLTMLDLNQMYVQKSEMEDSRYGISEEDIKLTNLFYGEV